MEKSLDKIFLKNSFSMYILAFTKMVIPFLTLPYLTRVLSVDTYGVVAYVKALMGYVQLIIDFGFMLSVTKVIADARKEGDWQKISAIVGATTLSRIFLGVISFIVMGALAINTPILQNHLFYTVFMFFSIFITIFWMDFLFRGIEQMEILSVRFMLSKIVSTILIFLLVKSDDDLVLMGLIEVFGSLIAACFTFIEVSKLKLKLIIPQFKECVVVVYHSFLYFLSNFSTTAFSLLVTFLIGFYLKPSDVAFWSLALQIVTGIQSFYYPVLDSLYPAMIREFRLKLVFRVLIVAMPLILMGCIFIYYYGVVVINIIAGERYLVTASILNYLIPLLIFSFPAMLFGWPILGTKGMVKEVTLTTILSSLLQIAFLVVLININRFTIFYISVCRCIVEIFLLSSRILCFYLHRKYILGGTS